MTLTVPPLEVIRELAPTTETPSLPPLALTVTLPAPPAVIVPPDSTRIPDWRPLPPAPRPPPLTHTAPPPEVIRVFVPRTLTPQFSRSELSPPEPMTKTGPLVPVPTAAPFLMLTPSLLLSPPRPSSSIRPDVLVMVAPLTEMPTRALPAKANPSELAVSPREPLTVDSPALTSMYCGAVIERLPGPVTLMALLITTVSMPVDRSPSLSENAAVPVKERDCWVLKPKSSATIRVTFPVAMEVVPEILPVSVMLPP